MDYYVEAADPSRDLGGLCECFIDRRDGLGEVAMAHVHRHFELLYCLDGCYELTVDGQSCTLPKGGAALIHPMEPHRTRTLQSGENRYLVLKFTPEALYSASQPLCEQKCIFPYLHFSGRHADVYSPEALASSDVPQLLFRILDERRREEFGYEMAVRAYVSQVLLWFLRRWNRESGALDVDERTLPRLQTALSFIREHLDEELSIGAAARALGMGESTFSRFFSRAAGTTFPAYVRLMRLSRAAELLTVSDRSVTDVAIEAGFSTASYLILCFRRQYGMTPARFRALYGFKRIET